MLGCRANGLLIYALLASTVAGCVSLPESDAAIELCERIKIGDPCFCNEVEFEVYVNVLFYSGLRIADDDIAKEIAYLAEKSDSFSLVREDDDVEYDSSGLYFVVLSGKVPVCVVELSRKDDLLFFHPLNSPLKRIKVGYMFYPSLSRDIRVCRNASLCKKIRQEVDRKFK